MTKSSHSVASISFTWAQQHTVSFMTFEPHTHTHSPTQHHQKCRDIHQNVQTKLHAEAALVVAKPVEKAEQAVVMEIVAKHHKHSVNRDKKTMA